MAGPGLPRREVRFISARDAANLSDAELDEREGIVTDRYEKAHAIAITAAAGAYDGSPSDGDQWAQLRTAIDAYHLSMARAGFVIAPTE